MVEENTENNIEPQSQQAQNQPAAEELGAAGKSLSEALRISFFVLKIFMVILVIIFLASGFKMIASDERALVLRFGEIQGIGKERILSPGPHWTLPYPIDEVVRIPVEKKVSMPINSFWYFQKNSELIGDNPLQPERIPPSLQPIRDGYCITRSSEKTDAAGGFAGNDYNIVHCRWQLIYKISDPELFFRNVYVEDVKPGEIYFNVITDSIKPLLASLFEDVVVTTMVNYTIDEALLSQDRIPKHVQKLLQKKLNQIESGIKVVSVQLTDITWPRQVNEAFLKSFSASQKNRQMESEARGYAENTLNEAAGPIAEQLFTAIHDYSTSDEHEQFLWEQLAGKAQEKIYKADAYRTKVVENAKANAKYLERILPEYRKRPELVVQRIYLDAIEDILEKTDEKMLIQPTQGAKYKEMRIELNRDPTLKPRSTKKSN